MPPSSGSATRPSGPASARPSRPSSPSAGCCSWRRRAAARASSTSCPPPCSAAPRSSSRRSISLMHDQVAALEARGVRATFLAATLDADEVNAAACRARARRVPAGLRRARAARASRLPRAAARPRLPARRGRRGALHPRVGSRLPARVPADRRPRRRPRRGARARLHGDGDAGRARRDPRAPRAAGRHPAAGARLRAARTWGSACTTRARRPRRTARWTRHWQEALGAPGAARGTAIVYAPTRRQTEEEQARLAKAGWRTAAYHAGFDGPIARAGAAAVPRRRARGDRRHQRVRHGHRPRRRAGRHPSRAARARSRPTTRRSAAPGATGSRPSACCSRARPTCRCAAACSRCRAREACPTRRRVQHRWGLFLELMRWAEGGTLPARRDPALLRRRGRDARRLRPLRRVHGARRAARGRRGGDGDRGAQGAQRRGAHPRPLRAAGRGEAAGAGCPTRGSSARGCRPRRRSARSRGAARTGCCRCCAAA